MLINSLKLRGLILIYQMMKKIFEKFFKDMDLNPESFIQKLNDPKIKDHLKTVTDNAFKRGIFGEPNFVVGSKIYFDKID